MKIFALIIIFITTINEISSWSIPLVVNTWASSFTDATAKAWEVIQNPKSSTIDALTAGCEVCQVEQCDTTVGFGGSPDENGETTLDALIFDGSTMNMGAIGGLRRIKNVISVARKVLELTEHSILVGDLATEFAKNFNYTEESLSTDFSTKVWNDWKTGNCQPNFWKDVNPDPKTSCGPYNEILSSNDVYKDYSFFFNYHNHDTIGMIVIDSKGNVAAGTSTNGANHKIPGRVGDSPIPGAGGYADNDVGAAVATGDGDVMMRFLPSFLAVEEMRRGSTPTKAAQVAIQRIVKKFPNFFGGVVTVSRKGEIGAACNGMKIFPFSVANYEIDGVEVRNVTCIQNN